MQWIDESALATWGKRTDARVLLIDMVADLIRATILDASRFRFPGGDAGQLRGWDGDLETAEAVGLVPAGKSKWEFGAGAGAAKASADYKKRTTETADVVMAENALVLVNLESWDTPRKKLTEWEDERKKEGKWRDVKYIDAVSLVHWLDQHPAVAARYAREVLRMAPKDGALSTDEFWAEFSLQFKPTLSEKVVIGDRQQVADELLEKLLGPAQSILLGAETSEEVMAFAVAAIRSAEPERRRLLESRTLIVRTDSAARSLSSRSGLIFIATKEAEPLAGLLGERGPTLSAAIGAQARRHQFLHRPTATGMAEGFVMMGLEHDEGYELAQRCGRSLIILKRLIPNSAVAKPEWSDKASALKPAFLAGGWSSKVQLDREILKELGGFHDYSRLESVLLPTLAMSDRPVDRVEDIWQVRAPVDAFYFYGEQITDIDLERLRSAVLKVFSHAITLPPRDQKFTTAYTAPTDYSKWLRDGLGLTLLIIAAMHDVAGLHINGKTSQQYVDEIVTSLPEWGESHQFLIRLGDQIALFAEAAPNPFLTALESMLEGDLGDLVCIFSKEESALFGSSSPHIKLLWAMEVIAWDPRHLNRAALLLAKLAELDPNPESNFVNRPINSLRSILLSWSPNTYAPYAQRIACLDSILTTCPSVGWQLLMKLLPRPQDFSSPTQRPKLKDVEPKHPEVLTFGLVWDFRAAVVSRAVLMAADIEDRIILLIKASGAFSPESRACLLTHVDNYLTCYQTTQGSQVWLALKAEIVRHEYYADSEWALQHDERLLISEVVERHQPKDPLAIDRQAFDDWLPHVGKRTYSDAEFDNPEELRKDVLERVLRRDGVQGILRLAQMVKLPNLIGQALRHTSITLDQLIELLKGALDPASPRDLAFFISAVGAEKFSDQWRASFKDQVLQHIHDNSIKVELLLGWTLDEKTWSFVDGLGEQVRTLYWEQIRALPIHGSLEQLVFAIEQLRGQSRDLEALGLVGLRLSELPTDLIQQLLDKGVGQVPSAAKRFRNMLPYYISKALDELRTRGDFEDLEIARLEYAYLPVLRFDEQPKTLIGLMAKDPKLFVEILSHVFRGKNAPVNESVSDEVSARASTSYDLLTSFRAVPGLDGGVVDADFLAAWVDKAREIAKEKDLEEVCDIHIGRVLAHVPLDPNQSSWPSQPVCMVIDSIVSDAIERGFASECFNKRGVFSRAINEGGDQERQLAHRYQQWAEGTCQYPRTSAMLAGIAESWLRDAAREDTRAELNKMKM